MVMRSLDSYMPLGLPFSCTYLTGRYSYLGSLLGSLLGLPFSNLGVVNSVKMTSMAAAAQRKAFVMS